MVPSAVDTGNEPLVAAVATTPATMPTFALTPSTLYWFDSVRWPLTLNSPRPPPARVWGLLVSTPGVSRIRF